MIYFLSDAHLGASYITDPKLHEARLVSFLHGIRRDATELYLMGDMLDFWFEYRNVVPRGFVRFFGALAELADSGVKIYWLKGNHDMWVFDYLPKELGVEMIDGPIVREICGKRFLLDHGDAVGERPMGFRILRRIFRNRVCRILYAAIHPRWTMALAHGWSAHSRKSGASSAEWSDTITDPAAEPLVRYAGQYLADTTNPHIDCFVFGHRHALLDQPLSPDSRIIILGDWINKFTYLAFDGENLNLYEHLYTPPEYRRTD